MPDVIIPEEIREILSQPSLKIGLENIDQYAASNNLIAVTSPNIFEPNSKKFHPRGLFSEEIFGSITSMERFVTEAVINLNTIIIHPMIFYSSIQAKALYTSIMAGKQYAVFNKVTHAFEIASSTAKGAGTGYQFFISNVKYLAQAEPPPALRANNLHKLLVKYQDNLTTSKIICLPAGLRDLDIQSSRLSKDDLNKLYMAVINLSTSLSSYSISEDTIFDGIRYQMQLKVAAVHDYLMDVMAGKGGFLQKHYGARKIAYSTRNVISVSVNDADTPDDVRNLKASETMIPMLNLIKSFQPFFTNYVKRKLYGELFLHGSTENVPAINPKTLGLEYITLKPLEINKYTTTEGVNRMINRFNHVGFRESAVSIRDIKGKEYWLQVTYTDLDTEKVFVGKSSDDLKLIVEKYNVVFDKTKVKPFTWVEAMYIAGVNISKERYCFITRYPVLEDGSIYPSKVHLITTNPSKQATIVFEAGGHITVPHYPILGNPYFESIILHPSRLAGLGADMDGDMVSMTTMWVDESNKDTENITDRISNVIGSDMKLKLRANQDLVELAIHNLSRQDVVV